jgi:RNA-dependent RNA polymerase
MEILVIRAKLMLDQKSLPPALRPLDCEISFDDIIRGGISIVEEKFTKPGFTGWQVTVTVSCKRPPRYFTEFENSQELKRNQSENRRRATAMDFAQTNIVLSLLPSSSVC